MSRRPAILLAVSTAMLIVVGLVVYLLRPVPLIHLVPDEPTRSTRESSSARVESTPSETRVAPVAPVPALPAEAPEDLRAEGARRGWQLPIGKGWWLDTLVNPAGLDPAGAEIEALQEQVLRWDEQLRALELQRQQRLDAYCTERIAAGLASADPAGAEPSHEGKERVIVNTHSPEAPGRFWRVDVGAGDDAALDALDREVASRWCEAVLELRRRFASLKR